jgi:hypothetical protein
MGATCGITHFVHLDRSWTRHAFRMPSNGSKDICWEICDAVLGIVPSSEAEIYGTAKPSVLGAMIYSH